MTDRQRGNVSSEAWTCNHCGEPYVPESSRQQFCKPCVPTKSARHRLQRYGISERERQAFLALQDGKCALCLSPNPDCVDHDHETGTVRGLLCRICNMVVAYVEDDDWRERCEAYLAKE